MKASQVMFVLAATFLPLLGCGDSQVPPPSADEYKAYLDEFGDTSVTDATELDLED